MRARTEAKIWTMVPVLGVMLLAVLPAASARADETDAPVLSAPRLESQPQQLPEIVAKIEDEVISSLELQMAMNAAMRAKAARAASNPNRDPNDPPESFDRDDAERVLDSLIRGKVIYVLAKKAKTSIADAEVEEGLAQARSRLPEGEFEHLMEGRGITAGELEAKMREQLTCQKFFDDKTKGVAVTDEDVEQIYERLKEAGRMQKPETADVAHILILAPRDGSDEDIAEAKERIDQARDRIVNGKEDFGEVAKGVSEDHGSAPQGGLYESVPPNMMVPEFDKLMFELPIGEVSEPFQTQFGWHIMKVSERDPARPLEFDEVKGNIRRDLEAQAKQRAFSEFLEQAIGDVKVEVLLPKRDAAAASPDSPAGASSEASQEDEEPELPDEPS